MVVFCTLPPVYDFETFASQLLPSACICPQWTMSSESSQPQVPPPASVGPWLCVTVAVLSFLNWVWGLIFIFFGELYFSWQITKVLVHVISVVSIQLEFHVLK